MTKKIRLPLSAALLALAAPALGADLPAPVAPAAPPAAYEAFDPWMIRVRAVGVLPFGSSADLYAGGAPLVGAGLKVTNAVVPEVDVSYFFTKNIAVEAICCVTPHKIKGDGVLAGLDVGRTLVFPPTVMLQYHFTDLGALKPYIGVGVNYTHFFRNKAKGPTFAALDVKDSFGVAGQIGFDYMLTRNWGLNVDVKRVMMQPDADVTAFLPGATPVRAKVKIDPWIIGVGVTYRFGGGAGAVLARY
ncbi:MAG TPA: OmpW family outer membrane protein [Beijerinckiaceae bacterium]|jgi:outer membrane protein